MIYKKIILDFLQFLLWVRFEFDLQICLKGNEIEGRQDLRCIYTSNP